MNKLIIYPAALFFLFFIGVKPTFGQFNIKMNVLSGTSTTTCTDPIGAPDPTWAVNIDNAGWVSYPFNGICYNNFPNEQFNKTYPCLVDIPTTIPVCFRAYENDATLPNPCTPVYSCQAEICIDVTVPAMGTVPFTITLPAGGPSGGSVDMNIVTSGVPGGINDLLCNAIPLGILTTSVPVGLPDTSVFNNFCATNLNEPDPGPAGGGWFNNQGVWFTFTTDANPTDAILVDVNSDPSNFGDPINLQVAIYESSDNTCNGNFTLLSSNYVTPDFDETAVFTCPKPNTTYFILVDGVYISGTNITEVEGWFGLGVEQLDVNAASELRCTAENLGGVPLGGTVSTQLVTNACSMNTNSSPASAFGVQKSVWFTFSPPPTGHVFVQGTSSDLDPIGIQMAIYLSSNGGCLGTMMELASQFTAADNDEVIELHCLDPNTTYFVMIDGATGLLNTGIFTLSVTDAGNETPTTTLNPVVCFGETFSAGGNSYNQTGMYADTLQLPGGCDSIVVTDLTVLSQVQVNLQVTNQGAGLGNTTGGMQVNPSGGDGGYTVLWSNGQTGTTATNLVGGDNFCVTVTDQNGCENDTCMIMPYYLNFIPSATGSSLLCNGDQNGTIEFSAIGGVAPYQFDWESLSSNLSGAGFIQTDGQLISIPGLPGGQYSIHIFDVAFDTTVLVNISEPTSLVADVMSVTNATCFGDCNGAITIDITGGTPPYLVNWANGNTTANLTSLCAGTYQATVSDANGCTKFVSQDILQPVQFTATASELQPVSCFQGTDGRARVTPSEPAASILWSNGMTTSTISGLNGAVYTVTVTNSAGCTASASVVVSAPTAPVSVTINQQQGVDCQGENSGILQAMTSGPGNNFIYVWSNGGSQPTASSLIAGTYSVTVSNENGCSATASAMLTQPTPIVATATPNEITCLDLPDAGAINVDNVTGGQPPYTYSQDGASFFTNPVLTGYAEGPNSFFVMDANGCVSEFQETINGPIELLVDLGPNKSIALGDSIKLQATVNQLVQTYSWSPPEGLSCTDCSSPIASPLVPGMYIVVVTTADGCSASGEVFIEVKNDQKVFVPNAFSPNGDGLNDEFMPFTDGSVRRIKSFRIFDRQGNNVYDGKDLIPNQPGIGWDGVFKGKEMQPAVFAWLAEIEFVDGKLLVYKGEVVLIR
ncbi:MAG: gliding motility-associated C-terminal domain-containing protein [Saprospiraceae bacterium]|nr:gliding motility-associated C-terminal domain-containing protein [Saprospiraceae bacterium]MCF8250458.1 gliding motility-associated C-terminal domain-containing protein [Saprospiraceae bacterium]MCF8282764.1 gliding motility-associated C-terminal domain-containing protein [Bacteroidales bacterium]MCF8312396.1 gliding motility-associated C-terminal domain-containing protein [Saprospiraceae bacterium]MCF8440607.1 gliding motility-associated C-terminal domain-containing protein [Saprospiraceae 